MPIMLVLGIETSGFEGSVALLRDHTLLVERRLNQVGRRHAQSLVLEIGELLRQHGLTPHDVDAVAVSRGPGSFTGLRVGMVCAKTFAYATNCRFIAVDTFAAIAENVPTDLMHVFVIEDGQRDDLFAAEFSREYGESVSQSPNSSPIERLSLDDESRHWKCRSPIQIVRRAEFLRERLESDIVTGPGIKKIDPIDIPSNWLSDAAICLPRASTIAKLGQRCLTTEHNHLSSRETDFWQASPFYLRLSAAEEKRASVAE